MSRRALGLAAVLLGLTGCLVGPDYRRPEYPVPADFRGPVPGAPVATAASFGDLEWWEIFQDATLVALIQIALQENYELRIAVARVLDARAQVTIAQSFLYPTVNAGVVAPYTRFAGSSGQFDPQLDQLNETFQGQGGFDAAYEIDLWGRIRRTAESARAQLLASEWARQTVISTLVSDVARAYFELRALDAQLEVSRQSLVSRQDSLRLVNLRLEGGVATQLDLRQAEILVVQAAQTIPDLERLIGLKENELSILLGQNPEAVPRGRPLDEQVALPPLPPGLTSTLLERRPDIRQAEQQLVAANALIGAAQAQLFPQVTLAALAGIGGNVFNGASFGPFGIFSIAPSISVPLFTAGRIQAGIDSADVRTQAAVLRYEQAIQQAFRETSDSLIAYEKNREFRIQKEQLVSATRDALRLSNIRYQGGVASYLEVLDSDTRRFDAELELVLAALGERVAVVQLYKALGGGWQHEPPDIRPAAAAAPGPNDRAPRPWTSPAGGALMSR